jgi:hypothetical protein
VRRRQSRSSKANRKGGPETRAERHLPIPVEHDADGNALELEPVAHEVEGGLVDVHVPGNLQGAGPCIETHFVGAESDGHRRLGRRLGLGEGRMVCRSQHERQGRERHPTTPQHERQRRERDPTTPGSAGALGAREAPIASTESRCAGGYRRCDR